MVSTTLSPTTATSAPARSEPVKTVPVKSSSSNNSSPVQSSVQSSVRAFPEVDDLLLCTVTAVQFHSVFVSLDEFGGRSGMIHISEIAPGRIKNIREYVSEGKTLVCKVLRIDKEKGHVDLSLRRVSESQRRAKADSLRQEKLSRNLVKQASVQLGCTPESLWDVLVKASEGYESVFALFEDVATGVVSLESLKVSSKDAEVIEAIVKNRLKPAIITIGGKFFASSYASNGSELIQQGLSLLTSKFGDDAVHYFGSGKFSVQVKDTEYKSAEKTLKDGIDSALDFFKKHKVVASFERS